MRLRRVLPLQLLLWTVVITTVALLMGCGNSSSAASTGTPLKTVTLRDVRTGECFTLSVITLTGGVGNMTPVPCPTANSEGRPSQYPRRPPGDFAGK